MEDGAQWMVLLRTLGSLALVLALIYGLSWVVKKYFHPETWGGNSNSGIKIIRSFSIEPKKKLMVVEIERKRMLLGVAENSISYLCSIDSDSTSGEVEVQHGLISTPQ